jgi:Secretion system C-terminal sorting domain
LDSSLYQTTNGGDSWSLIEPSPPAQIIYTIAIDTSFGNRILIGGNLPGIYGLDLITSVEEYREQQLSHIINLRQNYPNPFNPSTQISFDLDKSGFTTLIVYNLLGQKVATLLSEYLSAGTHIVNFNASNLTTGVYIYKLESNQHTAIKKMVLMR